MNRIKPLQFFGIAVLFFMIGLFGIAALAPVLGYDSAFLAGVLRNWEAPAFFALFGFCAAAN